MDILIFRGTGVMGNYYYIDFLTNKENDYFIELISIYNT